MPKNVADVALDGTTIEVRGGTTAIPLMKIAYGDGIDPQPLQRMGSQEVDATTEGAYKIDEITASMEKAIYNTVLLPFLIAKNRGSKNGIGRVRFPISVSYAHPELTTAHDTIQQAQVVSVKNSAESGGAATMVELKIKARQILWNGTSINKRRGAK